MGRKRSPPGRHSAGGGLYLNVTGSGARSWLFMYKVGGRRREMGLGSARDVPLGRAREMASEARQHLLAKRDPLVMRAKRVRRSPRKEKPPLRVRLAHPPGTLSCAARSAVPGARAAILCWHDLPLVIVLVEFLQP
jgi:hypothetical protein